MFRGSLPWTPLTLYPSSSWSLNIWRSSCTAKSLYDVDCNRRWSMVSSSGDWGENGYSRGDAVGGSGTEDNNGTGGIGGTGIEEVGRTGVGDNLQRAFLAHSCRTQCFNPGHLVIVYNFQMTDISTIIFVVLNWSMPRVKTEQRKPKLTTLWGKRKLQTSYLHILWDKRWEKYKNCNKRT